VLMPSTHCAFPRVGSRHLTSFRVVKFHVSAAHDHFWGGFDSRQLHAISAPLRLMTIRSAPTMRPPPGRPPPRRRQATWPKLLMLLRGYPLVQGRGRAVASSRDFCCAAALFACPPGLLECSVWRHRKPLRRSVSCAI
jgi:hypothetical protein